MYVSPHFFYVFLTCIFYLWWYLHNIFEAWINNNAHNIVQQPAYIIYQNIIIMG